MLFRNLILLLIIYLVYKTVKRWMIDQEKNDINYPLGKRGDDKDDVMIKDPQCGVYFPKREGIGLKVDGETVYFCSEKCRDDYKMTK